MITGRQNQDTVIVRLQLKLRNNTNCQKNTLEKIIVHLYIF